MTPLGWPTHCDRCGEPMPADDFAQTCDGCRADERRAWETDEDRCPTCNQDVRAVVLCSICGKGTSRDSTDERQLSMLDHEGGPDVSLPEVAHHKDNDHYYANEAPYDG